MNIFSKQMSLAEIVFNYPRLILVLERLGIYPGFGDKSLQQVASDYKISSEVILLLFEIQVNPVAKIEVDLHEEDIKTIIDYLLVSHEYYTSEFYPVVAENIDQLAKNNNTPTIELVSKFFTDYCREADEHFEYENKIAFPYVLALFDDEQNKSNEMPEGYSVDNYRENHDNIEEKLDDLKQLLIRYLPCGGGHKIRRKLILMIDQLESDLQAHARLENDVLVPLVQKLEKRVR